VGGVARRDPKRRSPPSYRATFSFPVPPPPLARTPTSREIRPVNGPSETLLAVAELIEEIIDRLDADGIAEDDEFRTLVAMLRGTAFQMLNDAGATGDSRGGAV
jgi:hypothetical protein